MSPLELAAGVETHLLRDPAKLNVQNILCPVDFSVFSQRALKYAASMACHFGARLFVQHTIFIPPEVYLADVDEAATRESLEAELRRAGVQGGIREGQGGFELPEIRLLVTGGSVVGHILESIEKNQIDLVVIGSHGRRGFSRVFLGSVAESIVHRASCPVLVISHPEEGFFSESNPGPIHLKTIIAATDFSPNSGLALAHALKWACEWHAKLILFHAVEKLPPGTADRVDLFPEYNPFFEKQIVEAWDHLKDAVPADARNRCEMSFEVCHGSAKEQIVQLARRKAADMIVMGSRGLGLAETNWGSTVSTVVRNGRYPVLAVRHPDEF
jgi:nucleotide-binding universal stress UspA family protein